MFSVFINERRKKKQLKVPKSPWLFYYPHPTEKRAPGKKQRRARETKSRVRWGWGNFPCAVCSGDHG